MMRTKTTMVALAAAAGAIALAREARADDRSGVLSPTHHHFESPQNFAIEVRLGPYRPDIDSDPSLHGTPYNDVFGDPPHLMYGLEFDWQALRIPHLGSLGPGVSIGRVGISRQAKLLHPQGTKVFADEDTSLEIFPMYVVAVLRVDMLMREHHIPLVPYAKAGLGYAAWRAYTDTGTSTSTDGVVGKGHTVGTQIALGLAFELDALDSFAQSEFDNSLGVNHTYLFFEYYSLALDGLGQSSALRVGNTSWALGLAFEF